MKVTLATLLFSLLAVSVAAAQSTGIPVGDGPGGVPFGAGTQRGLQGLNNSGQPGFVTLFDRGAHTAVVVAIDGAHGRAERVELRRGSSCTAIGRLIFRLHDLGPHGFSRSFAPIREHNLLSGNYLTVVYGSTRPSAAPVACGELYS